ncbi:MAG: GLPGLI family protein [Bergeyella zoohelcum]|nr:GLPGLI family protein [Bergeyella zoohelcum]
MKDKLLILGLVLFATLAFSQTNRYIYECQVKKNGKYSKMDLVLDITPDKVKFYDNKFLYTDSLNQINPSHKHIVNSISEQVIIRNRNTFDNISHYNNNEGDYFSIKTHDEMKWMLYPETKDFQGYKIQKATTTFGGRNWTAWFAPDVPIQEGPYKFRGLPGLIFQLYDDKEDFIYTLVKNKNMAETYNTSDFVETYYGKAPISITHKQYVKIKLDDYNDPYASLVKALKSGAKVGIDDEEITSVAQLDTRRKATQEDIKKHYTPIELDKAIPYP